MSIPGSANALLLASTAAAPASNYQIERSLRFNSSDSAFLSRTPAVAGNRRTWTWSGWIKRGRTTSLGEMFFAAQPLYICFTGSNATGTSPDRIALSNVAVSSVNIETAAVFRDFSAWFHLVVALDTTQTTPSDRVKIYVNGQLAAISYAVYPSLSEQMSINSTLPHGIGRSFVSSGNDWDIFSGYLADIHFIDGQALTPAAFTEVSATTGQLIPKAYAGTYTGNSFWLKFNDNSAATATTLGKDSFLLGNNWTPNNLSVTAGAGNDSLVDTPTSYGTDTGAGGEVRGNYATLNPLSSTSNFTLSNGNLDVTDAGGSAPVLLGSIAVNSGKWYWEVTLGGAFAYVGAAKIDSRSSVGYLGATSGQFMYNTYVPGSSFIDGSGYNYATASAAGANDVVGVALNFDTNTITFYKNGASQGTFSSSILGTSTWAPAFHSNFNVSAVFNFGQRAFAYTAPSGFKALCDTNLGAPLVALPNTLFDVKLYTGNGSTQTISGLGFSPDLVWIKIRNLAGSHGLWDAIRGTSARLDSGSTGAEDSTVGVTALNSDGFTVGGPYNTSNSWVAWAWDAGTTTAANTQGSITSQVRANVSAGFSVITWTGNATLNATIGHGLGVAPLIVIIKNRSTTTDWLVYTTLIDGTADFLKLNTTAAKANLSSNVATSSLYYLDNGSDMNGSGNNMVAYAFAPVVGYSSMGSYVGNGTNDGPFVYTGFRPRWILIKKSSAAGPWTIIDSSRLGYNPNNYQLYSNDPIFEYSGGFVYNDLLSNGFKPRTTGDEFNASGATYIYYAVAENPFQYARAR